MLLDQLIATIIRMEALGVHPRTIRKLIRKEADPKLVAKLFKSDGRKNRGPLTPQHRRRIGQAQIGKKMSAESRAKIALAASNRSPETLEKLRLAQTGRKYGYKTRARMSAAQMGHTTSDETRARISEKLKGRPVSDATRAKISESLRRRFAQSASASTVSKLTVKCRVCSSPIEVTPPDGFPEYEAVLKRGNVLCWRCFHRLFGR